MTKIEGGAITLSKDNIEISDVIATAVRRAKQTWPNRQIITKIAGNNLIVEGDAVLLGQLIFNLLDNANKYTPDATATTVNAEADGEFVVLKIEDEGIGIPPPELDHVFEKFYRVTQGDGRAPGTGLGLAICRGIASAMGGSIKAESPIGNGLGTRIVVRLPTKGNL